MNLTSLTLNSYRNINQISISPSDFINVIYGDNAQGKTNIIEAIWLFTGNASFRGARYQEMISFNKKKAGIEIRFKDEKREQKASILLLNEGSLTKRIRLNNVEVKRFSELTGNFFAVVFSPTHLSLVTDGPKNRRNFLDAAISQIKPQYKEYLSTYEKLLSQRNSLLKSNFSNLEQQLDIWNIQIAKAGTIISIYRNDYIKKLTEICKKYYKGLSSQKEEFDIKYISTIYDNIDEITSYNDAAIDIYYQKLKQNFEVDIKNGFTTSGIQRDDIELLVNKLEVKTYGSQGQQRSSVITLKLGEANLFKKVTGENPVMLLDDVMSELDEKRQDYILNHVADMQVFITCCDKENIKKLKKGKVFKIEDGSVIEKEEIL